MKAFVTGARRGIGRAIALALAGGGFDVAVNDVSDSAELLAAVAEISALGVKSVAVIGDISDLSSHDAMLNKAESALGPLTTLINNAGVSVQNRGDLRHCQAAEVFQFHRARLSRIDTRQLVQSLIQREQRHSQQRFGKPG